MLAGEGDAAAQQGIERLALAVCLVPVDLTSAFEASVEGDAANPVATTFKVEGVERLGKECVLRAVGHMLVLIVGLAVVIAHKSRVAVAVAQVHAQVVGEVDGSTRLGTHAACLAGVGHDAACGGAVGEDGHLAVATVDVEQRQVALEAAAGALVVRSQLVAPSLLGLVAHDVVDVVGSAYSQDAHQPLLQHVAEHLGVEAACLVTLAHAGIDASLAGCGQVIGHRNLGQQLHEMLAQAAAVVNVDGIFLIHIASGALNDAIAGVGLAVVVE